MSKNGYISALSKTCIEYEFYAMLYDVAGNSTRLPNEGTASFTTNLQDVESITLSQNSKSVTRGDSNETFSLTATIKPDDTDSSKRTLTWDSSNKSVATVDQTGNVTVKAKGTTNITATSSNGKVGACTLTVTQAVTGLSISPETYSVDVGSNFTITPTVSPSAPSVEGVTYSSSNAGVATVTDAGVVKGIAAGTATITVTTKGTNISGNKISKDCSVTVINPLTSLTLDKDQTTILKGGYTATVTATTNPSDYAASNITWSLPSNSYATMTVSGKTATITSTSTTGQVTLTVSAGGISKTVKISVVDFVTQTYGYTGKVEPVNLPAGTYKLECWGAQAGQGNGNGGQSIYYGGYGGYSCGNLTLTSNTILYICVGGKGKGNTTSSVSGGYNGGGSSQSSSDSSYYASSGGGATHIALRSGVLSSLSSYKSDILLVAGGGGGYSDGNGKATTSWTYANSGGGFNGGTPQSEFSYKGAPGAGGTQSSGYSFGIGQPGVSDGAAGGGGGFYGGTSGGGWTPAGGGSGYINTAKLTNAFMYGYNVSTSSATATKTYKTTNESSTPTSNYAKSGDGAVRITPIN